MYWSRSNWSNRKGVRYMRQTRFNTRSWFQRCWKGWRDKREMGVGAGWQIHKGDWQRAACSPGLEPRSQDPARWLHSGAITRCFPSRPEVWPRSHYRRGCRHGRIALRPEAAAVLLLGWPSTVPRASALVARNWACPSFLLLPSEQCLLLVKLNRKPTSKRTGNAVLWATELSAQSRLQKRGCEAVIRRL